jgi:PPM family protein phosphatase
MNRAIRLRICGASHPGQVRAENQDRFLAADLAARGEVLPDQEEELVPGPLGVLLAVADGMGGEAAGGLASEIAVEGLLDRMVEGDAASGAPSPPALAERLRGAVEEANRLIHEHAVRHPEFRGMGTTITAAAIVGDDLFLAQVGDSRAYLVREGETVQLTRDQSLLQHLLDSGQITPEEADRSERRNVILQALGPAPRVEVDLTHQTLRRGDALVLCSDGLSGLVRREEIGQLVTEDRSLDVICHELVALANARGGPDNVTVVVARLDGPGLEEPGDGDEMGHRAFDGTS